MMFIEGFELKKTYVLGRGNHVEALRGVNVAIQKSEMVAVTGPSGCGKSTLMHMLGLLQQPDRGDGLHPRLLIDGKDIFALGDRERTRYRALSIGFVFQGFNLIPVLSAVDNVALASEYAGNSKKQAKRAAIEALDRVGLIDRKEHLPTELSGGQQQRVAIARALVNEPKLLLADEPTGNLDSTTSKEILDVLRYFNRERGQTVVIVTHDSQVTAVCTRVLEMLDGVIL